MFCMICKKDLSKCDCPDIEERLRGLADSKYLIYKACLKCRKHYSFCECKEPLWGTSYDTSIKAEHK
jgi:hypothetical protein